MRNKKFLIQKFAESSLTFFFFYSTSFIRSSNGKTFITEHLVYNTGSHKRRWNNIQCIKLALHEVRGCGEQGKGGPKVLPGTYFWLSHGSLGPDFVTIMKQNIYVWYTQNQNVRRSYQNLVSKLAKQHTTKQINLCHRNSLLGKFSSAFMMLNNIL